MSLYKQWFITTMLRDALQGGANSTSKVTFKRMVASNDLISDKDFPGLTNSSMQTIKANQTALISSTTTKDDFVTITSVFNSFNVTQEYKMNTIYLVAEYNGREFLAAITSANDPYTMPVESKMEHAEYTIKAQIGISNTELVDLNMDPEAVATNEQLIAVDEKHDKVNEAQKLTLDKLEKADEINVKTVGNQQVDGTKTFLQKIIGSISGTAGTAIKLLTARKINGVDFDGTKDIVVEAKPNNDTNLVHKTGNETINGVKTYLLNIVGNLTGNADTASKLQTPRKIGGVTFDGSTDVTLPGVNATGNQHTTGDSARASKLKTARKINGVDFDGTKDIDVNAANDTQLVHTFGNETVNGIKTYLQRIVGSISGNAGSATKLETSRKVNGIPFDGTKDIVVEAKPNNDTILVHKTGNEDIAGSKTFNSRTRTKAGLNVSVSAANGNQNGNLYPLSIDVPNPVADGGIFLYGQTFIVNPNIKGQTINNYYLGLQGGGTTAIASGEAAASMATAMANENSPEPISDNAGTEQLILVSDQHVHIGAGYQNGGKNGKWITFYDNGTLKVPDKVIGNLQGNADTATKATDAINSEIAVKLKTPRKVNGVPFDGSKDIEVNAANDTELVHRSGNETVNGIKTYLQRIVGSISGNAGSATKMQTARTINGVAFDGTKNITLNSMPRGFDGDAKVYKTTTDQYGLNIDLVVSGNVGVLYLVGTATKELTDGGDILLKKLPADWPRPLFVTARGVMADVSAGWNFGSVRYYTNGEVSFNWTWNNGQPPKIKDHYIEGSVMFVFS
ncbi:hypothetical protein [Weissella tructae]